MYFFAYNECVTYKRLLLFISILQVFFKFDKAFQENTFLFFIALFK